MRGKLLGSMIWDLLGAIMAGAPNSDVTQDLMTLMSSIRPVLTGDLGQADWDLWLSEELSRAETSGDRRHFVRLKALKDPFPWLLAFSLEQKIPHWGGGHALAPFSIDVRSHSLLILPLPFPPILTSPAKSLSLLDAHGPLPLIWTYSNFWSGWLTKAKTGFQIIEKPRFLPYLNFSTAGNRRKESACNSGRNSNRLARTLLTWTKGPGYNLAHP